MDGFTIEQATEEDLAYMLSLAALEGWAPGLHDAKAFYRADPSGFFIGKLNGRRVGCISNVCYNQEFAFLGLYIVEKAFRKKGFGMKLWKHAMQYANDRCVGLDGVVQEQENYKKSGFSLYYRNRRYEILVKGKHASETVKLEAVEFYTLSTYDAEIFGVKRDKFLKEWIGMPNAKGFALSKDQTLVGYGVVRSCGDVYKIGPLFADDITSASKIFESLSSYARDKPIYLDVSECNSLALELAQKYGGKMVFETARMYTKNPPSQLLDKVFGITSFELG